MRHNPMYVWLHMNESFRAKVLLRLALLSYKLRIKPLCIWLFNRIGDKHVAD